MQTIVNPEHLPPQLIYSYDRRTNETWNLPEYRTPREYLDPVLQVKERQWASQKKGEKNRKYVTKRGFYMDYELKVAKGVPGSDKHGKNSPWEFERLLALSKHRKVDKSLLKRTFLDQIEIQQKNRKKPGVCTYSLQKSQKQKDAQIEQIKRHKFFVGQKHYFHDDINFLADRVPGSGAYNPHDHVAKIRLNKTEYKDWLKKHKEELERSLKREAALPSPSTYNPLNQTFTTFDLLEKQEKQGAKSKSKEKANGFGTDARFQYTRPDKKKIKEKRPDPISYNTTYGWREKTGSPKHRPWNEAIHKGYNTLSVYH